MFDHAVGIDAEARLTFRLGLEARPDVHAARIEPREERLLLLVGAIDEVQGGVPEILVHFFHALLVERTSILAVLLPPCAKPRIFARGLGGGRCASEHATRAKLEFE